MTGAGRVRIERQDRIAHVRLHNAERKNAISVGMWRELAAFCGSAAGDAELRSVIISGVGEMFSAGADISDFGKERMNAAAKAYDDLVEATVSLIEEIPQTVIAAIYGPCVGAGASLACACDFRICEHGAFFSVPAARLGLGYDPRGISRFLRIFGEPTTKEALLFAARIPAERAYALGAANRLVGKGQALKEAQDLAAQASVLAPLTQFAAKSAVRESGLRPPPSETALRLASAADASGDYEEGRAAFAAKRAPQFTGR